MHKKFFSFYGFFFAFWTISEAAWLQTDNFAKKNYRNNHEHEYEHEHTSGVQDNHM